MIKRLFVLFCIFFFNEAYSLQENDNQIPSVPSVSIPHAAYTNKWTQQEYMAAAIQFAPYGMELLTPEMVILGNLGQINESVKEASMKGAKIVVFSEGSSGIYAGLENRYSMQSYCEQITVGSIPANYSQTNKNIQTRSLSIFAQKYNIIVVAHICESFGCSPLDPRCPPNHQHQYSTQFVIDESGKIIARNRKHYLSPQERNSLDVGSDMAITFNTSFGVEFGMILSLDLVSSDAALSFKGKGIKNFVFSSKWQNNLPASIATEFQQGYSAINNANIIAANDASSSKNSGGGLYSNGEPLDYWFDQSSVEPIGPAGQTKIIYSSVPITPFNLNYENLAYWAEDAYLATSKYPAASKHPVATAATTATGLSAKYLSLVNSCKTESMKVLAAPRKAYTSGRGVEVVSFFFSRPTSKNDKLIKGDEDEYKMTGKMCRLRNSPHLGQCLLFNPYTSGGLPQQLTVISNKLYCNAEVAPLDQSPPSNETFVLMAYQEKSTKNQYCVLIQCSASTGPGDVMVCDTNKKTTTRWSRVAIRAWGLFQMGTTFPLLALEDGSKLAEKWQWSYSQSSDKTGATIWTEPQKDFSFYNFGVYNMW